ncbi:hypothetical protein FEM48_Zijuj06G0156800 [Ziziphus jujuba var. spinosa]|uniref:Uncharacterized protein n=1 Tax=Ziziphus jujuba var. spinosa TaxID=714518 RepID=A0A978VA58_ZIZJJ|nr:hypothetical protein FEM48_Zijuj06G0156800 [Ziziphus jujuba var. spinosa]
MEEIRSSESPPETHSPGTGAANPAVGSSKKGETSMASRMKKDCLAFLVSVQEGFEYAKAFFAKKMTAKSEEEAARADLQASKMQAEAADAAEDVKTRLSKSA